MLRFFCEAEPGKTFCGVGASKKGEILNLQQIIYDELNTNR